MSDDDSMDEMPSGFHKLDDLVKNMMSNAMADEHNFHMADKTINDKNYYTKHIQDLLKKLGMTWKPKDGPCPVDRLYVIIKIAGTPKGQPIGDNS